MAKLNEEVADLLRVSGATKTLKQSVLAGQIAGGNSDTSAYEGDSTEKPVEGDSLKALQSLAAELLDEARSVAQCAKDLADAKLRLADVQEHRLPDLMERHGLPKFEFVDRTTGRTLIIKLESDKWHVSMPPLKDDQGNHLPENVEARKEIHSWLRDIGNGGSLKKIMEVQMGLVSDEMATSVMIDFKAAHPTLDVGLTEKIESSTLRALITRLLKAGKEVHEKIITKPIRQAKVTNK